MGPRPSHGDVRATALDRYRLERRARFRGARRAKKNEKRVPRWRTPRCALSERETPTWEVLVARSTRVAWWLCSGGPALARPAGHLSRGRRIAPSSWRSGPRTVSWGVKASFQLQSESLGGLRKPHRSRRQEMREHPGAEVVQEARGLRRLHLGPVLRHGAKSAHRVATAREVE